MTITDERLAEIAADEVRNAIMNLAHERMGSAERLADEDAFTDLDQSECDAVLDHYEAQLRRWLGEGEPLSNEDVIRAAVINFSWSNYSLDEVEETVSDDWAVELAKEIGKALAMADRARQLAEG